MREAIAFARATATNLLAGMAPRAYLRLTGQTGRGEAATESANDIAQYFLRCLDDLLAQLGTQRSAAQEHLAGRVVVEYGPGDFPGVALLLVAYGAAKVHCVDRFAMVRASAKNRAVLDHLIAALPEPHAARLRAVVREGADGGFGFDPAQIEYVVRPHGFSQLVGVADLAISRAVLEHVDDLEGTFADMQRALKPGGRAVHQVDLKSHGLHRDNPLDFLEWAPWAWDMMFSHKGVPNRWRVDSYRRIVAGLGVADVAFEVTLRASPSDVQAVRQRLASPFADVSDEDLAWLGFWLRFTKPVA